MLENTPGLSLGLLVVPWWEGGRKTPLPGPSLPRPGGWVQIPIDWVAVGASILVTPFFSLVRPVPFKSSVPTERFPARPRMVGRRG